MVSDLKPFNIVLIRSFLAWSAFKDFSLRRYRSCQNDNRCLNKIKTSVPIDFLSVKIKHLDVEKGAESDDFLQEFSKQYIAHKAKGMKLPKSFCTGAIIFQNKPLSTPKLWVPFSSPPSPSIFPSIPT